MKNSLLVAAGLSVMLTASASALANTCPSGTSSTIGGFTVPDRSRASQDACQMAVDVFQFMAPQLGLALAGGNATLGAGSTLGGLGHFSVGLRANVFNGDLPQIGSFPTPGTNGRTQRVLPSKGQVLGLPTADAAIGLFGGLPFGLTNVGGVDVLLSAAYIPSFGDSTSDVKVTPDQNLQVGYGVRVGLLSESIVVPGVSVTYIKRDLPKTSLSGKSTNLDVNITNAKVETSAWRITASKSFLLFGVVVGGGQDKYKEGASIQATSRGTAAGTQVSDVVQLAQDLTRTNIFADLSLNLPLFKIVGEVGNSTGSSGSVITYNTFQTGPADKSRTYGSVGIRIGI
ncbi:MAG: hypothetical protein H7247_03805 [Polaromonas sp.]|nr:hypothetical protein [Gemmatimonadaceae bacterium]